MMRMYRFIGLLMAMLAATTLAMAQGTPCTGSQYTTNAAFFRAYASAMSSDATASKKKAMVSARAAVSKQINTKGEAAAKTQGKISGANLTRLMELIQVATRQQVSGLKVICESSEQTGGKHKTHLVVEVPKAEMLAEIISQVKSDATLKGLFEEGAFKQAF